jgi:hypothetical protein
MLPRTSVKPDSNLLLCRSSGTREKGSLSGEKRIATDYMSSLGDAVNVKEGGKKRKGKLPQIRVSVIL